MAPAPSRSLSGEIYTYGARLSSREIRLLRILPGRKEIRCTLTTHPLAANPQYDALSYAWGLDRRPHAIICDGRRLFVTKSLFHALCQLRRNGQTALLWVDAVCINQVDDEEKSVQVRIMRQIYESAGEVKVWLGLEEASDAMGLVLLRQVYRRCGRTNPGDLVTRDWTILEFLSLPGMEDPAWRAVLKILHRPYFSRIWIVQEFLRARRRTVLLGPHKVDGDILLAFAGAMEKYPRISEAVGSNSTISTTLIVDAAWANPPVGSQPVPDPADPAGPARQIAIPAAVTPPIVTLWFLDFTASQYGGALMLELLNWTRMFKAKDPRDRIFALVGLASYFDDEFADHLVDYKKPLVEVQTELARWFLKNHRRTESMMFSYVGATGQAPSLPSWVPDWAGDGGISMATRSLVATFYEYDDSAIPNPFVYRRFLSDGSIEIECTILDVVESTINDIPYMTSTPILTNDQLLWAHSRDMEAWEDACWDLAHRSNPSASYPVTDEHLFDAYWRTLAFDTDPERRGYSPPPEFKSAAEHWMSSLESFNNFLRLVEERPRGWPNQAAEQFVRGVVQIMRGQSFELALRQYASGRKFAATRTGYLGWVAICKYCFSCRLSSAAVQV
ncbi:heterokaryon incompatibility protein-domain-containing protein [Staphylotrichum tortipilum]|uniref:Heterokaryon incompatibility protein-domain-containing protein n=1 Tax=Staphylotrichum tortipilum TaxID=2831512 RepID=A0AAN6MEW8_9PEZI|nr:heterokaryon incompatibility protein-domain-containing protein [Staphylotrichum longicolle]